jgi:hypothetical protein
MRIIIFLASFVITLASYSQQVSYRIVESDPTLAFSKFVAPEYGLGYNSTDIGMFLGVSTRLGLTESLTLEGFGRYDVWTINGDGAKYSAEAGIFLPLKKGSKTKDVPIILSYNPYADGGVGYRVEETRSITIKDGTYTTELGLRAGLHTAAVGVGTLGLGDGGTINLGGLYLGGQMTAKTLIKTLINDDVYRYGAGFSRTYVDLFVLPVSELSDPIANDGVKKDGIIGWRAGMQWYVSPHDGEYRFLGRSVIGAEIGSRPLSGFMFNMSWGFAFAEKR